MELLHSTDSLILFAKYNKLTIKMCVDFWSKRKMPSQEIKKGLRGLLQRVRLPLPFNWRQGKVKTRTHRSVNALPEVVTIIFAACSFVGRLAKETSKKLQLLGLHYPCEVGKRKSIIRERAVEASVHHGGVGVRNSGDSSFKEKTKATWGASWILSTHPLKVWICPSKKIIPLF